MAKTTVCFGHWSNTLAHWRKRKKIKSKNGLYIFGQGGGWRFRGPQDFKNYAGAPGPVFTKHFNLPLGGLLSPKVPKSFLLKPIHKAA